MAAAALRLRYMLQTSVHAWNIIDDQDDLAEVFSEVFAADDCLPEYTVEIFRYLLHDGSCRNVQRGQIIFNAVLNYLEVHLLPREPSPILWLGRSSQLSSDGGGCGFAAVALLKLILDRNLEVVNAFASSAQQERLVNLLHLAFVESGHEDAEHGWSLITIVHEGLHSAHFWEQKQILSSFFVVQHAKTAFLDTIDIVELRKNPKSLSAYHTENHILEAVKAYTLLLYAPSECLPKASRNNFIRRAVILDFLLGSVSIVFARQAVQVVRTFLNRIFDLLGTWEHETSGKYLHHLITSPVPSSAEQVTGDLVQGHLVTAFRAAVRGNAEVLLGAIKFCIKQPIEGWLLSNDSDIPLRGTTQRLVDIALSEPSVSTSPRDLVDHLSSLFEHVLDQLHPMLHHLASGNVIEQDEITSHHDVLLLWGRVITLGRSLNHHKTPSPGLGTQIVKAIGPFLLSRVSEDPIISKFSSAVHALLISELKLFSGEEREDRESHLQLIVTTYVAFEHSSISRGRHDLDENMSKLLRTLPSPEFFSCLQFVLETISSGEITLDMTACLIHLMSLAMLNAPENTLKTAQTHVKECLNIFVNNAKLSNIQVTRLAMLTFISDLCSKRPASVRLQNVISIWILLSRLLAGSKAHDSMTNVVVFHEIISIIDALVRLRRDLVITTLPQLGNIMRQLVFALRSPRPLLGAKQRAIVADALPAWINPSYPLGVEESKLLSRLLTSLSAKTLIRVHGPPTELQKPESLARPLSKHVACVLQAYLDVLNDPLCVLSAEVRRELQPGLFVVCDMLNEYTRDALMVSALDAGGKAAMQGLWREYEKQRYTGKG
ncbi:Urb2/Npa2 family-domain-containing protein [Multifurca ochricompacta]|uniref:Urb2/Npa2 family-domain-containing protein n=1 Tax=Multifurca ochricompacta TaxID=376703 RepID=A0AAD4MEZ7_9AGAM|nr:Urb2/Npa2 family-domain-containing protein [Multifurca ochricompacta]